MKLVDRIDLSLVELFGRRRQIVLEHTHHVSLACDDLPIAEKTTPAENVLVTESESLTIDGLAATIGNFGLVSILTFPLLIATPPPLIIVQV